MVKFITETTGNDSLANEVLAVVGFFANNVQIFQQLNASVEKSVTKFMLSNADVKYLSDEATLLVHTQAESHFQVRGHPLRNECRDYWLLHLNRQQKEKR